jgi:hypothetical protein
MTNIQETEEVKPKRKYTKRATKRKKANGKVVNKSTFGGNKTWLNKPKLLAKAMYNKYKIKNTTVLGSASGYSVLFTCFFTNNTNKINGIGITIINSIEIHCGTK